MDKDKLMDGIDSFPKLPKPSEAFKQSLLEQTEQRVRRRAHVKWLMGAAAIFLAYWLGLISGTSVPESRDPKISAIEAPDPMDLIIQQSKTQDLQEKARLLQKAGDLYLKIHNDVEKAVECYSLALDIRAPSKISPSDSWLFVALKGGRQ